MKPIQDNKRLLLMEPPFYRLYDAGYALVKYPLSLAYLAAAAKEKTDWDVRVFNADFAPNSEAFDITYLTGEGFRRFTENIDDPSYEVWRSIRNVLSDYQPSVLGISVKSSGLACAYRIAGIAKELNRETIVIVGGPHPSATGPEMLDNPHIDVCVPGEGEEPLIEILRTIEKGAPLFNVGGIFFRNGWADGTIRRQNLIADLDSLGFPLRYARESLIDYPDYPLSAFGYIFATRGCPQQCLFCGSREVWGKTVRFRSPGHVREEIAYLYSRGVRAVHFDDDTFGVNHAYLESLCRAMARHRPEMAWSCETHVRLITEKNLALMKEAGCKTIQLGIESGNDGILKKIRKGFTIKEALGAVRLINDAGIGLQTFFMAGFPWETEQTLQDTREVMEKIECEKIIYSLFTPYPGTEAFQLCRAEKLIPDPYNPSLFGHQSPRNHFCLYLTSGRFRKLSGDIEEMVVKKNRSGRRNRPPDPS